jgi:3-methyladenine DNA glycosylase AlkD
METAVQTIQQRLFALQDLKYRDFQRKLIPTVDPDTVIGVRTPQLRALAKELAGTPEASEYIKRLPHRYYDENNLHGFLIEKIRDYDATVAAMEAFLPYVDNWATCDLVSPKVFQKHLPELLKRIRVWLGSGEVYTVRFGIGMLMSFYLDDAFSPEYPELVAGVRSEEYYVNMMIAWYFATALNKQWDEALPYIEQRRLDKWTHNKAIQKALESYRITEAQKTYLRTLKIK